MVLGTILINIEDHRNSITTIINPFKKYGLVLVAILCGVLHLRAQGSQQPINSDSLIITTTDDDYDTIGGFVTSELGKIPAAGEDFIYDSAEFRVMEADERFVD